MPCSTSHAVSESCPGCAPFGSFERNNYFTGKFLTELDFKIETAYHAEKQRHHNARLHGAGVVCGLKVTQDTNPACRDRFVLIEPGTAIDCCGREIVLEETEQVQLDQLPAAAQLIKNRDDKPHRLQICLRFRECPTEPVPVLYDDCGCDDNRCAPNRILESFTVDAILDAPPDARHIGAPGLNWGNTLAVAHAAHVALDEANRRLYVLTADDQPALHVFHTDNFALIASSAPFDGRGLALAVSPAGDTVFLALMPAGNVAGPRRLLALDATTLAANRTQDIPDSDGNWVVLSTGIRAPGKALVSLLPEAGRVQVWPDAVAAAGADIDPAAAPLGPKLAGLAIATGGLSAYTLDPVNNLVKTIALDPPGAGADIAVLPAGSQPVALAVSRSTGPDRLVVVGAGGGGSVHLLGLGPDTLLGSSNLDHLPTAVAIAAGGGLAYVLENEAGKGYVQPVNLVRLQNEPAHAPGAALPVGDNSVEIALAVSGRRLFAAFTGNLAVANAGGIAVVDITETACEEIFWKSLDGCPGCDTRDCIVLATIENYAPGFAVLDPTDPPTDPAADQAARIARIDNRAGRKLLPSTTLLKEAIECLFTRGGGEGRQGPPGDPGLGIDAVQVNPVPCDQPPQQPTLQMVGNARTLFLDVPDGCLDVTVKTIGCNETPDARRVGSTLELDLPPALSDIQVVIEPISCDEVGSGAFAPNAYGVCELRLKVPTNCDQQPKPLDFPHICAINWPHGGTIVPGNSPEEQDAFDRLNSEGFLIAFDKDVLAETLTPQTFRVLYRPNLKGVGQGRNPFGFNCYCDIIGEVTGLTHDFLCAEAINEPGRSDVKSGPARLARFRPLDNDGVVKELPPGEYQIILDGDQVLGDATVFIPQGRDVHPGVDADHMGPGLQNPPWLLPRGLIREPTGDGVEGGTFLSWFSIL